MDSVFQNRNGEDKEHPSREALLLFVDGELASKEASQLDAHLEACWPCRVKTKRIQEAIADIIEFDEAVLMPRLTPPQDWRNFDRQLRQLAAQSGSRSLWSRVFGSLGRFLPVTRLAAMPPGLFTPIARAVVAILVVAFMLALFVRFNREQKVSAEELLRNVSHAQAARLRATTQPVIHQRLQVRRKTQAKEETAGWETWIDSTTGRFVQTSTDDTETRGRGDAVRETGSPHPRVSPSPHPLPELVSDLAGILAANHMDSRNPLSAASFESWRNTLQHPQDQITRTKLSDGTGALTLRTVAPAGLATGQISEAALVVRASDWQPAELHLIVPAADGQRVYELTASVSEVVSLSQIDPKIFASTSTPVASSSPSTPDPLHPTPEASSPLAVAPLPSAASAQLEVEVLDQLNRINAFYGEQLAVTRTTENQLRVQGIVDTDQRKKEIMRALAAFKDNPALQVEVETVAEATAREAARARSNAPVISDVDVETKTAIPADTDLRAYLSRQGMQGDQLDEAIRRFADRMLARSREMRRQALALKQLAVRFSAEDLRTLDEPTRSKWRGMLTQHARQFRQEIAALRRDLQPIFPNVDAGGGTGAANTSDADLATVTRNLFELATSINESVNRSFSIYVTDAGTAPVKSAHFAQTLNSAEAFAAAIGRQ